MAISKKNKQNKETTTDEVVATKETTTDEVVATKETTTDEVVVKNISNFTQHHDGEYFSPGLEVRTKNSDFVKAAIKDGLFVVMGGK